MSGNHIPFVRLSRYHDGDFFTLTEKSEIERHLAECPECRQELQRVEKLVGMLAGLSRLGSGVGAEFAEKTIRLAEERRGGRRRKGGTLFRGKQYVPAAAVAAIVVAVVGISIFSADTLHNISSRNVAAISTSEGNSLSRGDPVARVMEMVRNGNGTVLQVSDSYIIAETSPENLIRMQSALGGYPIRILGNAADRGVVAVSAGSSARAVAPGAVRFKVLLK